MKNKLLLGLTAIACIGTAIGVAAGVSNRIVKAEHSDTRTIRFDTWKDIINSDGTTFGLNYYGQANGIPADTRTSDKIGVSNKNGSMLKITTSESSEEMVCFRDLVNVKVSYSAECNDTISAIQIYNHSTNNIGDGIAYSSTGYGTLDDHGQVLFATLDLAVDATVTDPVTGKHSNEDRYVSVRVDTFYTVTIYWIEVTYRCSAE